MSGAIELTQFVQELKFAAGPGAGAIASSVTASGKVQAATGIVGQVPGVGLRSVLARYSGQSDRGANAATAAQVPQIAGHMAADALRRGVELLSGDRR